ncbi:MAG: hypothetical protein EBX41_01465 [Chitinophagia bacterium]|nr:hypothetical protein [Chitinophagia bacterium]
MHYSIKLNEPKTLPHQVTALHLTAALAFIGAGSIIYVYCFDKQPFGLALLLAGIAVVITAIKWQRQLYGTFGGIVLRFAEASLALGVALLAYSYHWTIPMVMFGILSLTLVFALYWEKKDDNFLTIEISEEGVKLPKALSYQMVAWSEINDVILKYGILTVSLTNNKLLQWQVHSDSNTNAEQLMEDCKAFYAK